MSDPIDDLFVGDLADFVRRRDDLVRQLRKDGDKDAAAAVKQLRKPSAVAWAVNQVARQERERVAELLAAADEVRAAQARAVEGRDADGLRTASRKWRGLINAAAAKAAEAAGAQYRDEAASTFEAASADEELRALLTAGRLTSALSPSGFGLAGMPDPPERMRETPPEPEPEPAPHEPEPIVEENPKARKRLEEREAELTKAVHRLRRAEQRLEAAQQAVEEAAAARDAAQASRDEAAAEL
jgi:hypothetical protein